MRYRKMLVNLPPRQNMVLMFMICLTSVSCCTGCFWNSKKGDKPGSKFPTPGQVVLRWNAAPDLTFNIYRRSENGSDIRINNDPVKPMEAFSGGKGLVSFQYVDRSVVVGEEYYYTLEQIAKDGKTDFWETPWKMTAISLNPPGQTK